MLAEDQKKVVFRIFRFNSGDGGAPRFQEYTVPVQKGMTVLDGLVYIKENLDGTIAYRSSCRMGICGSCGMIINGFPQLACQTQILHLESQVVEVRPLSNYPVIKDVVPDLSSLMRNHTAVRPYIIRLDDEKERPTREYLQSPQELEAYLQFAYCIKCGLCLAACPTVATDASFLGPQALAAAYRYIADSRDSGMEARAPILDTPHGVWRCHFAGACTEACPKGVDPALAIQLLKRALVLRTLRLARVQAPAPVAPPLAPAPRPDIPKAPEPTVALVREQKSEGVEERRS